jgi:Domain of unknown function (DUF4431)
MRRLAAVCCVAVIATSGPAAAGDCMKSDAGPQSAEGEISILDAQDAAERPERVLILTPVSPVCLDAEDPEEKVLEAKTVHIYSTEDDIHERLKASVGKTILVWGDPFPAHTAHHHAPIVMDVSKIGPE